MTLWTLDFRVDAGIRCLRLLGWNECFLLESKNMDLNLGVGVKGPGLNVCVPPKSKH